MSQEIYVKEMPKIYYDSRTGNECIETKGHFIVKSLHDHDKELVEKVLEKTKTFVRDNTYICGGNATRDDIITSSSYNQALRDVLDFMQTLQKEFEDENNKN